MIEYHDLKFEKRKKETKICYFAICFFFSMSVFLTSYQKTYILKKTFLTLLLKDMHERIQRGRGGGRGSGPPGKSPKCRVS